MYTIDLYLYFVQLRKQLYKIKKCNWYWKYSQIELNKAKYKTFQRFYDEAYSLIYDLDKNCTVQDIFDEMLDKSQSKKGLKINCY